MLDFAMATRRPRDRVLPMAAIGATLLLFGVATALQSRWIAQLSDAELQRARIRLQASVRAVQSDVNRELSRAYLLFQWEAGVPRAAWGRRAAEALASWRRAAQYPALIRRILAVEPGGISAFDESSAAFHGIPWPGELIPLRAQLRLPFERYDVF